MRRRPSIDEFIAEETRYWQRLALALAAIAVPAVVAVVCLVVAIRRLSGWS